MFKQFPQKILEHSVPKKELCIVLLYIYDMTYDMSSLTKKHQQQHFLFVKLKLFLDHQHD